MKFLLMPKQEVSSGETPCTFGTFERLLLGVGTLMAFEMLKASKRSGADCADMGSRFVVLRHCESRAITGCGLRLNQIVDFSQLDIVLL